MAQVGIGRKCSEAYPDDMVRDELLPLTLEQQLAAACARIKTLEEDLQNLEWSNGSLIERLHQRDALLEKGVGERERALLDELVSVEKRAEVRVNKYARKAHSLAVELAQLRLFKDRKLAEHDAIFAALVELKRQPLIDCPHGNVQGQCARCFASRVRRLMKETV